MEHNYYIMGKPATKGEVMDCPFRVWYDYDGMGEIIDTHGFFDRQNAESFAKGRREEVHSWRREDQDGCLEPLTNSQVDCLPSLVERK